jgi:hypothetical protein
MAFVLPRAKVLLLPLFFHQEVALVFSRVGGDVCAFAADRQGASVDDSEKTSESFSTCLTSVNRRMERNTSKLALQ